MSTADRIYVTGAAGMIGSNITRSLVESGYNVIGIDNLWRGTLRNIGDLLGAENFSFRHADIVADRDWYRDMTRDSVIIHTADIVAGIGYVFANEWSVFQKNILINSQIARIVSTIYPRHLIYLGTACSYPQSLQRTIDRSALSERAKYPADPESGYGWSKLIGEVEFRLAVKNTETRFTVLDLHNVYGWPCVYGDATAQVIPSLIYKACTSCDGRIVVWGDGSQGRAFLHVSDAVNAVRLALEYQGSEATFMIGPNRCISIKEVASLIVSHPDIHIEDVVFDTTRPTGDIGRFSEGTLARDELGWQPVVDFREGLFELIDAVVADIAGDKLPGATISKSVARE